MNIEYAVWLGEYALWQVLLVGGPVLGTALVVGAAVSILQTVTQIQEATLVFIPKILSVYIVVAVLGAWMLQLMVSFGTEMFLSIPETGP